MYPPPTTSKTAGNIFQIESSGRIHQARRIELERWNNGRPRAGREDDPVETENHFGGICFADPQRGGILKRRAALNVFHVALLGKLSQSSGKLLDHTFFPGAQPSQIDLRRRKFDPPVLSLLGFFNQLGDVQQRLRRNAAAVEAHAARVRLGIDQRHLHAEIGGQKGGCVAAWSAADYSDVQLFSPSGFPVGVSLRVSFMSG